MTREEADELQKVLDEYEGMKDAGKKNVVRWGLAMRLAPLVPDIKIGDFNATMLLGSLAKLVSPKLTSAMSPMRVAVVDGHEEWEPTHATDRELEPGEMHWDEYEEKYCIRIPGDLAQETLNYKSKSIMADMMFGNSQKKS